MRLLRGNCRQWHVYWITCHAGIQYGGICLGGEHEELLSRQLPNRLPPVVLAPVLQAGGRFPRQPDDPLGRRHLT